MLFFEWGFTVILCGAKTHCVTYKKFRILGCINFLPMALSRLPQALCLKDSSSSLAKGSFVHFSTDKKTWTTSALCLIYNITESMSVKERENFMRSYEGQRGEVLDIRKVIVTHCKSDVTILRRACAKFRKLFKEVTTVDIFRECVTTASSCMQTFRKNP